MQGDASERIPILLHHCRQSVVDMAVEPPKTTEHSNDVYMLAPTVFRTAASGNLPREAGDTETEIWRMCQIFSAAAGVDSTRFVNKPLSLNRPLIDKVQRIPKRAFAGSQGLHVRECFLCKFTEDVAGWHLKKELTTQLCHNSCCVVPTNTMRNVARQILCDSIGSS